MGIKWKDFEMPRNVVCNEDTYTDFYGEFTAEPFEKGYGMTIGNSLRRVLLSSIEGAAITSIKIDGALHEFSTLPNVVEDVSQIILNVKQIVLRSHSKQPKKVYIKTDKEGDITAKDIETDETVEVINPDQHILTVSKKTKINIEMDVSTGRGYVLAEANTQKNQAIGTIPVDSIFTPVKKVNYRVENTRVHQVTEYDRLILEIWTNGSISPKHALLYASNILQRHLDIFVGLGKLPEEEVEEVNEENQELKKKLMTSINELELSVRSANCLKQAGIKTIGELVSKDEKDMLNYKNFGKKSLTEIGEILSNMNLSLGMEIDEDLLKGE